MMMMMTRTQEFMDRVDEQMALTGAITDPRGYDAHFERVQETIKFRMDLEEKIQG